jgi:hypothetical protein
VEVKCIFSTTPEAKIFSKSSWIEMEVNGDHWDNRTWSRHDQTCPVSGSSRLARDARASRRRIRSLVGPARSVRHSEGLQIVWSIGRGGASGHDQLDASGREWTLTRLKPDAGCNTSGQFCSVFGQCFAGASAVCDVRVRSMQVACPVDLFTVGVQVTVGIMRTTLNVGQHVDGCE